MSTADAAELARHCLCGGPIMRVTSSHEAERAQSLGAVGVLCDFPPERRGREAFREIFDAISILPMCLPRDRELLQRAYHERFGEEEPGGYFILSLIDASDPGVDPRALAWTTSAPPWPAVRPRPLFARCANPGEARDALLAGADGMVLLFLPSEPEMDAILGWGAEAAGELERRPGERIIGVAALQGDYHLHARALEEVLSQRGLSPRVRVALVRGPQEFDAVDALVLPGGWSNLQTRLMRRRDLDAGVRFLHARGVPMLGVCAGMILSRSRDGTGCEDRLALGLIDVTIDNNIVHGWRDVRLADGERRRLRFAKAPVVARYGPGVQVLATLDDGTIVAAGQARVQVSAFHDGIHESFVGLCLESWKQDEPRFPWPGK